MSAERKGVGALFIAYVVLFVVIGAVVGVVFFGGNNAPVVDLRALQNPGAATPARQAATVAVTTPLPQASGPAGAAAPASAPPAQPTNVLQMPPPPEPVPVESEGQTAAADSATASTPPVPVPVDPTPPSAPAADPAPPLPTTSLLPPDPPASALPQRTSLYPAPPPEKPPAPAAPAAAAPAGPPSAVVVPGRPMPPALIEQGPHGPLPRVASDGRLAWVFNNTPFDHATSVPRLSVIVAGLGINAQVTEDAIVRLPPQVTLAFVPYAENLARWVARAREYGHEVLISLPMEGGEGSERRLGPRVLTAQASEAENLDRLRWVLSRAQGYVGIVTWEGDKLLNAGQQSIPVLKEIATRGLMVVDSRQGRSNLIPQSSAEIGLPFARSRGFLDAEAGLPALDANLVKFETLGQRAGFALAMAMAQPDTIARLAEWSASVTGRGFVLAPVTGVTECREICQQRVARHAEAMANVRR